jgi:hypothetical protein
MIFVHLFFICHQTIEKYVIVFIDDIGQIERGSINYTMIDIHELRKNR